LTLIAQLSSQPPVKRKASRPQTSSDKDATLNTSLNTTAQVRGRKVYSKKVSQAAFLKQIKQWSDAELSLELVKCGINNGRPIVDSTQELYQRKLASYFDCD